MRDETGRGGGDQNGRGRGGEIIEEDEVDEEGV